MTQGLISTIEQQEQAEKRLCQRIKLNRQMQLTLADGQIIRGVTENISLRGMRIITHDIHETRQTDTEQTASIQIKFANEQLSPAYPCSIVRYESDSVCLQLDSKKAASFGMMLTRGTLKKVP